MYLKHILFIGLFLFILSCSKEFGIETENTTNDNSKSNFAYISTEILDKRCAKSGCHVGDLSPDLRPDNAYANIVNVNSSQGMPYIMPGKPDSSYLYLKITGAPGIVGFRMPRDRATSGDLSQDQLDAIRIWIEQGALNN